MRRRTQFLNTRGAARAKCLVALGLALGGCLASDIMTDAAVNAPPLPALRVPVLAPAGGVVELDASESVDPDGDPLTFAFAIDDVEVTPSTAESKSLWSFAEPGLYTVSVLVTDARGEAGWAVQDVTVVADLPNPPDLCSEAIPCTVGDVCVGGLCYSTGGALE